MAASKPRTFPNKVETAHSVGFPTTELEKLGVVRALKDILAESSGDAAQPAVVKRAPMPPLTDEQKAARTARNKAVHAKRNDEVALSLALVLQDMPFSTIEQIVAKFNGTGSRTMRGDLWSR